MWFRLVQNTNLILFINMNEKSKNISRLTLCRIKTRQCGPLLVHSVPHNVAFQNGNLLCQMMKDRKQCNNGHKFP